MNPERVFDGKIIAALKELILFAIEMIQYALPAVPVGAWIVVMGLCFGIAARTYSQVHK